MQKIVTLTVLLTFLSVFPCNGNEVWVSGPFRTWTSANGMSRFEARLVDVSEDAQTGTFLKKDGSEIDITLERLSQKDREFIQNRKMRLVSVSKEMVTVRSHDGELYDCRIIGLTRASQKTIGVTPQEARIPGAIRQVAWEQNRPNGPTTAEHHEYWRQIKEKRDARWEEGQERLQIKREQRAEEERRIAEARARYWKALMRATESTDSKLRRNLDAQYDLMMGGY